MAVSPRKTRRPRPAAPAAPLGPERIEDWPDGDWVVRAGARRGGDQGVPLPRLRPGALPGDRARGGVADARGRGVAAALAHRVLAAAHAAPPRLT